MQSHSGDLRRRHWGGGGTGAKKGKGHSRQKKRGGKGLEAGERRLVEVGQKENQAEGQEAWVPASPGTHGHPWISGAQFPIWKWEDEL